MRSVGLKFAILLGVLSLALPGGLAALGGGTSDTPFDNIGVGAGPAGMGGAYTAAADDVNAPFWNPAGLALVQQSAVSLMHMIYLADINYDTFSYVVPTTRLDGWGVSAAYLWQPPFDSTSNSFGIAPQETGEGTGSDLALAVSYGHNFGNFRTTDFEISNISLGGTFRYISTQLQQYKEDTFNLDFGGMMEVFPGFRVAAVAQNVGSTETYINDADPSVPTTKLAFSYKYQFNSANSIQVAYDVEHPIDLSNPNFNEWTQNLGGEYWLMGSLALRGGYDFGYDVQGLTAGAGFVWDNIGFDYAFVPYGDLGNTQRVSINYSFGSTMKRPEVAAPGAPQGLKGVAYDQLVSLAWDANPESDVIGYNVYYSDTQGKGYVLTTEKPEPKQNKLNVRLRNGVTYYFVITAVNAAGKESELSDEIALTPHAPNKPQAPSDLKVSVVGRTVTLTWSPNKDKRVVGYNVYYTQSSGSKYRKLTKAAPLTDAECRLRGLTTGAEYYFVVTSVTRDGLESDFGAEVKARPREDTINESVPEAEQKVAPASKPEPSDSPF